MNISHASNFRDFSKIAKLNTREFLEWPIEQSFICIEYQHYFQ